MFAASIAVLSLFFNSFFTLVFVLNTSLRQSPLYYFGILAVLDIIMAINYLLLMAVPVYMDQFEVSAKDARFELSSWPSLTKDLFYKPF